MLNLLSKLIPQNFNDSLALVLVFGVIIMWVLTGLAIVILPDTVLGATIATWTLVVQFYFRKHLSEK